MSKSENKQSGDIAVVVIFLILEIIYFRGFFFEGKGLSETADGLLTNLTMEHIFDAEGGHIPFSSFRAFYPQKGSIGYSDLLLAPTAVYSVLRLFGTDLFMAHSLSFIIIHLIGTLALYFGLRKTGLKQGVSCLAVIVVFYSCTFSALSYHVQFYSMGIAAAAFLFAVLFYTGRHIRKTRMLFGTLFVLTVGMCFMSSFYTAYIITLYCAATALLLFLLSGKRMPVRKLWKIIINNMAECIYYLVLNLVWMILFGAVYIPVLMNNGGYESNAILSFTPYVYDLFRTFSYAPLETCVRDILPFKVDHGFETYAGNRLLETSYGWPFIVYLIFILCIFLAFGKQKDKKIVDDVKKSMLLGVIILMALFMRYGDFSPWILIGKMIPGAAAIRATGRGIAVLLLPAAIVMAWIVDGSLRERTGKGKYVIQALFLIILLVTSISRRFVSRDVDTIRKWVADAGEKPEDLKILAILSDDTEIRYDPVWQMYGWLLADHYDVYCINGYGGNYPDKWNLLNSDQTRYIDGIDAWKTYNDLPAEGFYFYTVPSGRWIPYEYVRDYISVLGEE